MLLSKSQILQKALQDLGDKMKANLKVKGMHCNSCEMLIADALEDIDVKAKVDSKKEIATVEFDESKVTLDEVKKAIEAEGYKVE